MTPRNMADRPRLALYPTDVGIWGEKMEKWSSDCAAHITNRATFPCYPNIWNELLVTFLTRGHTHKLRSFKVELGKTPRELGFTVCCLQGDELTVSKHFFSYCPGADKSLAHTAKETSSELCQGRARFQQHRDESCHEVFFFPLQGFFPSWSG